MVVEINNRCELVYDLNDVSNIIRKYYNGELADEMDRLLEEKDNNQSYVQNLEDTIGAIRKLVW